MTERPTLRGRPVRPCDGFPNGQWQRWRDHVLDVPYEILCAAAIAERLKAALDEARELDGRTARDIAGDAQLSPSTVSHLSRCIIYPTSASVICLELVLDTELWPLHELAELIRKARARQQHHRIGGIYHPPNRPAA